MIIAYYLLVCLVVILDIFIKDFMNENKLYPLYSKIIGFRNYVRTYLVTNIPNVNRDIRIHLMNECYKLLGNL